MPAQKATILFIGLLTSTVGAGIYMYSTQYAIEAGYIDDGLIANIIRSQTLQNTTARDTILNARIFSSKKKTLTTFGGIELLKSKLY